MWKELYFKSSLREGTTFDMTGPLSKLEPAVSVFFMLTGISLCYPYTHEKLHLFHSCLMNFVAQYRVINTVSTRLAVYFLKYELD